MNNYYLFTSFICGAIVMIIEIVGTKILTPFFGSGLFVWSSTITVTMLALSVGYFIGGKKADKVENLSDYLYAITLSVSIFLLFTYDFSKVIYYFYNDIDIRFSTFVSSFILLFAPLTLLGMISPIILKLTAKEFKNIGNDLGFIYAISTLGSLVGSLLAGFILLAYFGTREIFSYCSMTMMLLSIGYFIKKKKYFFITLILPIIFIAPKEGVSTKIIEKNEIKFTHIDKREGFYGTISVLDIDRLDNPNYKPRLMLLDGIPQGGIDKVSNKSLFHYHYVIEEIINQLNKKNQYRNILFVGIGAGLMPTSLKDKFNVTLVDINPVIVEFAKKYYNLSLDVNIEDARAFINKSKKKNDIIVVDAFSGETLPNHLLTKEFMKIMKSHITENGAVIFNIIGDPYSGLASKAIINTISSEFSSINVLPLKENGFRVINYIVVAKNENTPLDKKKLIKEIYSRVNFDENLAHKTNDESIDLISDIIRYKDGDILTDNFNKIDFYSLEERKDVRKIMSNFLLLVN